MKNNDANANDIIVAETQFNPERFKAIARGFFIRLTPCLVKHLLLRYQTEMGRVLECRASWQRESSVRGKREGMARKNGSMEVGQFDVQSRASPCPKKSSHIDISIPYITIL